MALGSLFSGVARGLVGPFAGGGGRGGGVQSDWMARRQQPQRGGAVMGQGGGWVPPNDPSAVHDPMQSVQQPDQGGTLGDLVQPTGGGGNIAAPYMPRTDPSQLFSSAGPQADPNAEAPEETMGAVEAQQQAAQPPPQLPQMQPQQPSWKDSIVYAQQGGGNPPTTPDQAREIERQAQAAGGADPSLAYGPGGGVMGREGQAGAVMGQPRSPMQGGGQRRFPMGMQRPQPPMARMQRPPMGGGGQLGDLMRDPAAMAERQRRLDSIRY